MSKEDTLPFDTMHATEWEKKLHNAFEECNKATKALRDKTQENEANKQVIEKHEAKIKKQTKTIASGKAKVKKLSSKVEKTTQELADANAKIELLEARLAAAGLTIDENKN